MSFEVDRISDESDRATCLEDNARIAAIAAIRREEKPPTDWDKETCYECGEDLPEQRIVANRFLCVTCKSVQEKRMKGF